MTISTDLAAEHERRHALWQAVSAGTTDGGSLSALTRSLKLYGGQAGIWRDKSLTASEWAPDGIAVSLRHTGSSYDDDLSDDGLLYHFPSTQRAPSQDAGEIASARMAYRLGLPVFVLVGSRSGGVTEVRMGYIEDCDDQAGLFLLTFVPDPLPIELPETGALETSEITPPAQTLALVRARPNQRRFAAAVYRRYGGTVCAVCDVSESSMVQAAHLLPFAEGGPDDARNGLPLCANHHIALDAGLWRVNPATGSIQAKPGKSLESLTLTRKDLGHLPKPPDPSALEWLWAKGFVAL